MAAPTPERLIELGILIEGLEKILNSGASSVTVDGRTTVFDLDSIRERIKELKLERSSGDTDQQLFVPVKFGS